MKELSKNMGNLLLLKMNNVDQWNWSMKRYPEIRDFFVGHVIWWNPHKFMMIIGEK